MTTKKTPAKKPPKVAGKKKAEPFEPGLYLNMTAAAYHADPMPEPSASASWLADLYQSTPAHARLNHPRLNPEFVAKPTSTGQDFGSAAHAHALGNGHIVVVDARNWQTDAAKHERRRAQEAHSYPILKREWPTIEEMVKTLRADLSAKDSPLPDVFDPKLGGISEVTVAWKDEGLWCRARLDRWLPPGCLPEFPNGLIVDYKTTAKSAAPGEWKPYDLDSDFATVWYPEGVAMATGSRALPDFRFIVQETYPPFAHTIHAVSSISREHTKNKIVRSFAAFHRGMKTGEWPKYPKAVVWNEPPPWELSREERSEMAAAMMQRP